LREWSDNYKGSRHDNNTQDTGLRKEGKKVRDQQKKSKRRKEKKPDRECTC
jgi:hypothetical protein